MKSIETFTHIYIFHQSKLEILVLRPCLEILAGECIYYPQPRSYFFSFSTEYVTLQLGRKPHGVVKEEEVACLVSQINQLNPGV